MGPSSLWSSKNSAAHFKELVVHLWPLALIARRQIMQKKQQKVMLRL